MPVKVDHEGKVLEWLLVLEVGGGGRDDVSGSSNRGESRGDTRAR